MPGSIARMRRIPRALAAALVGAVASIPVSAGAAHAADSTGKCPAFSLTNAAKTPLAFHARVAGAGKKASNGTVSYPVTVVKMLKGVPVSKIRVTLNPGPCQPKSLITDEDYYFFVIPKGSQYIVAGTQPMVQTYTDKLQAQIGKVFPAAQPQQVEPEPVRYGKAQLDPVSPLTKLVAPGVGLTVIGLLGFLVVWLVGRRTTV